MKTEIAGLNIDPITKKELIQQLERKIKTGVSTWLITAYSEFLYAGLRSPKIMDMLNKSDISIADGIGIFWAKKYLSLNLNFKNHWLKLLQAVWQAKYSLACLVFYPKWISSAFPEKIVGADFVWDIARLAAENNYSIYLLGGFGDTPKLVAEKLTSSNSSGRTNLRIAGWSNKNAEDASVIDDINKAKPDILLVAYGPIRQEEWIFKNRKLLPKVKLFMGVGGSFDYISGIKLMPPKLLRKSGFEWLWRLLTQPYRHKRIIRATLGLVGEVVLYKLYSHMEFRKNAVAVIINNRSEALVCKRNPSPPKNHAIGERDIKKFADYWQFPQGGIDAGEKIESAAAREAIEEVGLANLSLIRISSRANFYWFNLSWDRIFKKNFRWKGQTQNIVYFRHLGTNNQVSVDRMEFTDYKWVPWQQIPSVVHEERKNLCWMIVADLKEMAEKGIL